MLAIVGNSGGMKGVFVQGVLLAFEEAGLHADAYAGASASALPVISAATKRCGYVGAHYWLRVQSLLEDPKYDLSQVMYELTHAWNAEEPFAAELFEPGCPRLFIPTNHVAVPDAAAVTQGAGARRLGRRLLVQIARKDRSWIDANLELHLFDTHAQSDSPRLTADNLADVAYASTRMIHWRQPAWIEGRPYVDCSYTCACPAPEMFDNDYTKVIVISTETGPLYRDVFADRIISDGADNPAISAVRPDMDLKSLGVDFAAATRDGLLATFEHGHIKGHAFLSQRP